MLTRTALSALAIAIGVLGPISPAVVQPVLLGTDPAASAGSGGGAEDTPYERLEASAPLRRALTVKGVRRHQAVLQSIANRSAGTRVAGSPGHDRSAVYVFGILKRAGYDVRYQEFEFPYFQELSPSQLRQVAPAPVEYVNGTDFLTLDYAGTGSPTARVQAVDINLVPPRASTSGCEAEDFNGFVAGNIALVQRGTCTFFDKARNAEAAGAAGIIVFNQGNGTPELNPDRYALFGGTLGEPVGIPAISASYDFGVALYTVIANLQLNLVTDTLSEARTTRNVLADTRDGDPTRLVVVGAHLDSVAAGPGINDNGSGTAAILEIALQMAEQGGGHGRDKAVSRQHRRVSHDKRGLRNKVRFAFWSAEEEGLRGSVYYVNQLSEVDRANHLVNLNFDMVGSPNFVRFVYDGDGSAGISAPGPEGSAFIEEVLQEYFASKGLPTEPTAFDGRSDYGPFIGSDIPAGGVFSGAEGIKTTAQAAAYGGTAGEAYDSCYHQACDAFENTNNTALRQLSDAAAHAVWSFARTPRDVRGTATTPLSARGDVRRIFEYRGSQLER